MRAPADGADVARPDPLRDWLVLAANTTRQRSLRPPWHEQTHASLHCSKHRAVLAGLEAFAVLQIESPPALPERAVRVEGIADGEHWKVPAGLTDR